MKKNLTKILVFILAFSVALFAFGCNKNSGKDPEAVTGKFEYKLNEDGDAYIITGYQVSSDDAKKINDGKLSEIDKKYREITIPENGEALGAEHKNYPVKEIEAGAFGGNKLIEKVEIKNNIEKIGKGAFGGLVNLKEMTVSFIGASYDAKNEYKHFGYIFGDGYTDGGNTSITAKAQMVNDNGVALVTGSDVTYYLPSSLKKVTYTGGSFNKKSGEETQTVTVKDVASCAFYGVTTLTEIILPESVGKIGQYAFYGCSSLAAIDIKNVTEVPAYAFSGCSSLKSVTMNSVTVIGAHAFEKCAFGKNLAGVKPLNLPAALAKIGEYAFSECASLEEVNFGGSISVIPSYAFNGCAALKTVKLKNDADIKNSAFKGCTELKKEGNRKVFVNAVEKTLTPEQFGAVEF